MEMKDAKNIIVTKIRIHGKNISIKHLDVKEPKISVEKKLMQNFCIAYRGIMSHHELYATGTTGRMIEEVTNLTVHKFLAGHTGGEQQLGAMIESNDLDMMIFLRDPQTKKSHDVDINNIFRFVIFTIFHLQPILQPRNC